MKRKYWGGESTASIFEEDTLIGLNAFTFRHCAMQRLNFLLADAPDWRGF